MATEEWIGSLITMLGLAFMFFFNQKREEKQVKEEPKVQKHVKERMPSIIQERVDRPLGKSKHKKPPALVSKPSKQVIIDDLDPGRSTLPSSKVTRLGSISSLYGDSEERKPRIRKIMKEVSGLRNLIICREILERKKF